MTTPRSRRIAPLAVLVATQLLVGLAIAAGPVPASAAEGVGPRVEESGANLIPGFAYSAPMEDLKLKAR
jgi:hypothetical protein